MALLCFIGLNAADALLTGLALALGAVEVNPVQHLFAAQLGLPNMMALKVLFAVALGGVLWQRRKARLLMLMNYLLIAIVLNNTFTVAYLS